MVIVMTAHDQWYFEVVVSMAARQIQPHLALLPLMLTPTDQPSFVIVLSLSQVQMYHSMQDSMPCVGVYFELGHVCVYVYVLWGCLCPTGLHSLF